MLGEMSPNLFGVYVCSTATLRNTKAVISAIQVFYNDSHSAVMVDGSISAPFQVTTGVLQGDVLAPFLFIILVDLPIEEDVVWNRRWSCDPPTPVEKVSC